MIGANVNEEIFEYYQQKKDIIVNMVNNTFIRNFFKNQNIEPNTTTQDAFEQLQGLLLGYLFIIRLSLYY